MCPVANFSVSAMPGTLLRVSRGVQSFFFSERPAVLHRAIHTSVWWDTNTAQIPKGWDPTCIAAKITDSLAKLNYSAPVTFSAYLEEHLYLGDDEIDALSSTGIKLIPEVHFSEREPDLGSKQILHDLRLWTEDHPAPANCLFITGDKHLLLSLHRRPMKGYNILLARPKELGEMEAVAKTVWRWKCLLAGYPPERTNK